MTTPSSPANKWLVVKLADIGDLLLITPALGRLRAAQPAATIHVLTTAHSAPILPDGLVDQVILFDKFAFDRPTDALRPANLKYAVGLARQLRGGDYTHVLILHHLTTRFGALKYAGLALTTGAKKRSGLDNGRGWFLNTTVPDKGFGGQHEVEYWLQVVDQALGQQPQTHYQPGAHPLLVNVTEQDRQWVGAQFPTTINDGPRIVIHTGSGGFSLARRWDSLSFAQVADALHEQLNAQIILVGGPDDNAAEVQQTMHHDPISVVGQTSLSQLSALLAACDLFIGADSGVMHLAAAAGTNMITLFGPSNAPAWRPWSTQATVLRSSPSCSPCSYVMSTVGQRDGCPARTCMRLLTPQTVIETAHAVLNKQPASAPPIEPAPPVNTPPPLYILGVPLHPITWDDLHTLLKTWIAGTTAQQICTANPEFVMVAQQDVHFYTLLNRVALCVADGQGLLWAANHLKTSLPDRITGSDGVPLMAQWAAEEGWRIFLLGAAKGVAEQAATTLQERYPGLQIAGTYAGSPDPAEEDALVAMINESNANLLFVAYGAPKQDKWIARNLPRLNVQVATGVGGALDFIVGVQKRAPKSWQRFGLEWLYRLLQEPWRWKRMLRLPRFVLAVLRRGSRGPVHFVGPKRK
ncbi:WecB/TagA/CpsF family glycosyltransferase [Chloroflexota bacterium]